MVLGRKTIRSPTIQAAALAAGLACSSLGWEEEGKEVAMLYPPVCT